MSRRPIIRPSTAARLSPLPALLAVLALVLAACGGPVLANPPAVRPVVTPEPASTPRPPDPIPVILPRDDGPHDRLTEWWYYTGNLADAAGQRYGFQLTFFRRALTAQPASRSSAWAASRRSKGSR